MNWFKKLLKLDNVEIIDNTQQKYPWLESDKYLLVQTKGKDPMMFTLNQVKDAQSTAKKNPDLSPLLRVVFRRMV